MDETMEIDSGNFQALTRETEEFEDAQGKFLLYPARIMPTDYLQSAILSPPGPSRDNFRDIQVKVHIRRPERDSWVYMGRGIVTQEVTGHSSRVGEHIL
jgi:hypothetical protein